VASAMLKLAPDVSMVSSCAAPVSFEVIDNR
jgi:hypothetical protein